MHVTKLSESRSKVVSGRTTYYVKRVRPASEDFDPWHRMGTPALYHVDAGEGPTEVLCSDAPESAVQVYEHMSVPRPSWAKYTHVSPAGQNPPGASHDPDPNGTNTPVVHIRFSPSGALARGHDS